MARKWPINFCGAGIHTLIQKWSIRVEKVTIVRTRFEILAYFVYFCYEILNFNISYLLPINTFLIIKGINCD